MKLIAASHRVFYRLSSRFGGPYSAGLLTPPPKWESTLGGAARRMLGKSGDLGQVDSKATAVIMCAILMKVTERLL